MEHGAARELGGAGGEGSSVQGADGGGHGPAVVLELGSAVSPGNGFHPVAQVTRIPSSARGQ